jgi:hypothetical protein
MTGVVCSRYPIIEYEVKNLTHPPSDPDSNSRVILYDFVVKAFQKQLFINLSFFSFRNSF